MSEDRPASLVDQVEAHLHQTHAAMRDVLARCTPEALDWRPGPDTNSIAAIFTHSLDAERHLTAWVAGIDLPRDREAAFLAAGISPAELGASIDGVERNVHDHLGRVTDDRLAGSIARGERTHSGAWWLLQVVGHSREHLGQAELTLQLAAAAHPVTERT